MAQPQPTPTLPPQLQAEFDKLGEAMARLMLEAWQRRLESEAVIRIRGKQ